MYFAALPESRQSTLVSKANARFPDRLAPSSLPKNSLVGLNALNASVGAPMQTKSYCISESGLTSLETAHVVSTPASLSPASRAFAILSVLPNRES